MTQHNVTLIPGDGVGPEVANATRRIIDAAGVKINWEVCEAGAVVFKKGLDSGVPQETIDSIARNRVALKGPLETPVGFGGKSANVTLRKLFETFSNIRPVIEMPGVKTPYSGRGIDLVIVRENVEDLYAGIEHMQSPSVAQCLKLISKPGCEKIARMAFEVARSQGRKTVQCATKANIMKMTEGLLKRTFEEVAKDYPDIESHHIIVDNCAHQLVKKPEQFDVLVMTNMNGDILSDLSSALVGGLGFAPGANIGHDCAIFEAVHGSAPKYAGADRINPTALLFSGVMMLRHLGELEAAERIEQAVWLTLEKGICTQDVVGGTASTTAYTDAIISHLGQTFAGYIKRPHKALNTHFGTTLPVVKERSIYGVDVFVETLADLQVVGKHLDELACNTPFALKVIANRGVKVYPTVNQSAAPDVTDASCCRFVWQGDGAFNDGALLDLLQRISTSELLKWTHVEKLNIINGENGFSKSHGED